MPIYLMERSSPGYEQPTHYALITVCDDTGKPTSRWFAEAADSKDIGQLVKAIELVHGRWKNPVILDRHESVDREWRGLSIGADLYRQLAKEGVLRDSR